jgi:hypothetical protein
MGVVDMKIIYIDKLKIEPVTDTSDEWAVIGRFRCCVLDGEREYMITVPAGSRTDGASIPRFAWSIIGHPFNGEYRNAAIVHDFCYRTGWKTRALADKVFLDGMEELGAEPWRRRTMYMAVRIFGRGAYAKK